MLKCTRAFSASSLVYQRTSESWCYRAHECGCLSDRRFDSWCCRAHEHAALVRCAREDATRRTRLFISVWICRDFKIHPRFGQFWSTFVTYMSTPPAPPLPGPRANTVLCRTSISLLPPVIDSILSTTVPVGEIDTCPIRTYVCTTPARL